MHIPNCDDYLKILTDNEVKVFISFSEYFKSMRETLYSKVSEGQNLKNVAKSFYIFLTTSDEVEKYAKMMQSGSSDYCAYHYNI